MTEPEPTTEMPNHLIEALRDVILETCTNDCRCRACEVVRPIVALLPQPPSIADGTMADGLIDGLRTLADRYGEAGVRRALDDPDLFPQQEAVVLVDGAGTEWASLLDPGKFWAPGEVGDLEGNRNREHALVFGAGYIVIEGTSDQWISLAQRILRRFDPEAAS